jgi:hypothetical protein
MEDTTMLGERIGEETSRTTNIRVVSVDHGVPKMEVCATGTGKVLGIEYKGNATYCATGNAGGGLNGEGQGVWMTKEGEVVTWKGIGTGRPTKDGGVSWRGLFSLETRSQKLAKHNPIPLAFEYEVDGQGDGKGSLFEWK